MVWRRYRADEDRCAGSVPGSEEGATSPCPISCAGCGGGYRGPLAFVAPAGCRIPTTTTRERHLLQGHRCVNSVCTEGRLLLSFVDRGGGNGLRPPLVREAGVAASRRPFSGSVLGSRGLHALCWTDKSRPDPCPRQGPADGPLRGPRPCLLTEPRTKSWQTKTGGNSDAAIVATARTSSVGVAAKMVGATTTTTTAGVTAVVEAGEAHRVLVWLRTPPRGHLGSNNQGS